jgi:branched-chain amino acid transport system permease protein
MTTQTRPSGDEATTPAARPWAAVLAERVPIRRIILVALSIFIAVGVVLGSYKTLTMPEGRISGAGWRDFLIAGIALGSIYALIALGYSLVYGILLMINFAHGEVFMMGAFASYFVAESLASAGMLDRNPLLSILILLVTATIASMAVAVLLERVAYRPLRNAPRLVPLITAIGASLFLQYTSASFFGSNSKGYPDIPALDGEWKILGVPIAKALLVTIVTAAVMMAALTWFITRTRTGKAMRAVAEDKEIASLMGINVNRVIVTTFAVGGFLAGVAGVMFALVFGLVQYNMGFIPGIKAFTAAVLGGIGSVAGAAVGGLILGVVESVAPVLLLAGFHVPAPNQLRDVVAFSILVLVLIFRPGGIFGSGEPDRG